MFRRFRRLGKSVIMNLEQWCGIEGLVRVVVIGLRFEGTGVGSDGGIGVV